MLLYGMDDRRTIDLDQIADGGYLIARCGRFCVHLDKYGNFSIVDGDMSVEGINCSNINDMHDAITIIRDWLTYHKFKG